MRRFVLALVFIGCGRSTLLEADGGERLSRLDAGQDGGLSCASPTDETELLRRWNVAATGVTVTGNWDFKWTSTTEFPHPTYRGGSPEAYTKAAIVLTRLLKQSGTRDFLEHECLVDRAWATKATSAVSLRQLALLLCSSTLVEGGQRAALCTECQPWGC